MYSIPTPSATEPCLAARLRYVHRVILRIYEEQLRGMGLTVAQLDLLMTLAETGGRLDQADLGRNLEVDRSTVTRNLQRLQRVGYVTSGPGVSGRERRVALTNRGRERAEAALPRWRTAQDQVKELLGGQGVRALETLYLAARRSPRHLRKENENGRV